MLSFWALVVGIWDKRSVSSEVSMISSINSRSSFLLISIFKETTDSPKSPESLQKVPLNLVPQIDLKDLYSSDVHLSFLNCPD